MEWIIGIVLLHLLVAIVIGVWYYKHVIKPVDEEQEQGTEHI